MLSDEIINNIYTKLQQTLYGGYYVNKHNLSKGSIWFNIDYNGYEAFAIYIVFPYTKMDVKVFRKQPSMFHNTVIPVAERIVSQYLSIPNECNITT